MTTLTAKRPLKDYTCSQSELYAGLDIVWNSQEKYQAEFEAENSRYVAGLAALKKLAIDAARDLPDPQVRVGRAEILRIDMTKKCERILDRWNWLSGFINMCFPGEYYRPRIEEAGKAHYRKAYKNNWEHVQSLTSNATGFIAKHEAALINDGGMPATFKNEFNGLKTEFDVLYNDFMKARQQAKEETDEKIFANNAIYADARAMMKDGKHLFRKQAAMRNRFTWEKILQLLGSAKGEEKTQETGFGINLALVQS